ncbi:MAG: histidine phosphatase family protein [Anaerolineae bacterium]|nr:histidine phosphatase family protein [Anaerolineae bacterium]
MRLLFVRHGQTQANTEMRLAGWTDSPLDAVGEAQARAVAAHLAHAGSIDRIYTSPLQRAQWTAATIADALGGVPVEARPALRERNFGMFENLPVATIAQEYPDMARAWAERGALDWGPPGGEMPHEFADRVLGELCAIVDDSGKNERALVVTHGGVIALALARWLSNDPTRWRDYLVDNCSLTEVEFSSEPRLVRMNEHVVGDVPVASVRWESSRSAGELS